MSSTLEETRLLVRNDVRLLLRHLWAAKRSIAFSTVWIAVGLVIAHAVSVLFFRIFAERGVPLRAEGIGWMFFAFLMLGAGMANAISLIHERSDFDLLFASPVSSRAVLLSRILTLILGCLLTSGFFFIPLIDGLIVSVSFRYLVGYVTWLLLAVIAASIGTTFALSLVRWLGVRRARTWVQIVGGVVGAGVYLAFQTSRFTNDGAPSFIWEAFTNGPLSLPGRFVALAGRGSPLHLGALVLIAIAATAFTTRQLSRIFLAGVQESVARPSKKKAVPSGTKTPFREGVFRATFIKELRLIRRDPLLLSQVLPSIMYVVPAFFGMRSLGGIGLLAPLSVVIASQFAMLLTYIAVNGEEGLDLIQASPLRETQLRRAKVSAALAIPGGLAVVCCAVVAFSGQPILALIGVTVALATGAACSWLQSAELKPSPRADVLKQRRQGMTPRGIAASGLMLVSTGGVGVLAANAIPLLGVFLLGVATLGIIACFVFVSPEEYAEAKASS